MIDEKAAQDFAKGDKVKAALAEAGDRVVAEAKRLAPRRTGRGAESIDKELVTEGDIPECRISYGSDFSWMGLQEVGTRYIRPHAFLRPALNAVRR